MVLSDQPAAEAAWCLQAKFARNSEHVAIDDLVRAEQGAVGPLPPVQQQDDPTRSQMIVNVFCGRARIASEGIRGKDGKKDEKK